MRRASDSGKSQASDSFGAWGRRAWIASEPNQMLGPNQMVSLGRAADVFRAVKEAEGLSPRSIVWYAMILDRLIGRFGAERAVDELAPPELRAWLVELRATLAPVSVENRTLSTAGVVGIRTSTFVLVTSE
jgi:hypothetical protein